MPTPNLAASPAVMPPGLQTLFAKSLRRASAEGDAIQSVIDAAARDYGQEGSGTLSLWWALYADKGRTGGVKLQYLYVQREAYTDLERRLFEYVSTAEAGVQQSDGDVFRSVAKMREQANADITLLETQARASRAPAVGVLTATAPAPVCPVYRDPNSPAYRGDPLARRWPFGW